MVRRAWFSPGRVNETLFLSLQPFRQTSVGFCAPECSQQEVGRLDTPKSGHRVGQPLSDAHLGNVCRRQFGENTNTYTFRLRASSLAELVQTRAFGESTTKRSKPTRSALSLPKPRLWAPPIHRDMGVYGFLTEF